MYHHRRTCDGHCFPLKFMHGTSTYKYHKTAAITQHLADKFRLQCIVLICEGTLICEEKLICEENLICERNSVSANKYKINL